MKEHDVTPLDLDRTALKMVSCKLYRLGLFWPDSSFDGFDQAVADTGQT